MRKRKKSKPGGFIKPLVSIIALLCLSSASVDEYRRNQRQEIADYEKRQRADITGQKRELAAHVARTRAEYEQWRQKQQLELAHFRHAIKQRWGSVNAQVPHRWVEYSADTQSVATVNFKSGEVLVSVLLEGRESRSDIRRRMTREVTRILSSPGGTAVVPIVRPGPETDRTEPLLRNLIKTRHGVYRGSGDAPVVARDILDSAAIRVEQAGRDAKHEKTAATIRFSLVPGHIESLMRPYLPLVDKYAARFNLDPAMVLAMIHTESHFNPMARSPANALGLMQLLPDAGGRDAYAYITGKDKIPLDDLFLDPEKNIELGCAYVHLLKTRHFGRIHNPTSNRYCTIAGYNTGPGNVAYAFTGKRIVPPAIVIINRMSDHNRVYSFMIENLPYRQTRRYLQDVVRRMTTYADASL